MEEAVTFGSDHALLGVYAPAMGDVCCLFANAGVIHRIGPHRMNVKLARELSRASIASLRFDLSGLGDSRASANAHSYIDQAVADFRAAMDWVEGTHGKKRFIIFGICSGAVNAHRVALVDDRVVGILAIDGYWYKTRWTRPAMLWARLRAHTPRTLLALLLDNILRRHPSGSDPDAPQRVEIFATDGSGNPPKAQFCEEMERLTTRGVSIFLLYSGSVDDLISYQGQLRDAFPNAEFIRRTRIERHPDVDHTAMTQHSQRKIEKLTVDWARQFVDRGAP